MKYAEADAFRGMPLIIASIALSTAVFMQVLDTTIANVSLPYIAGDLGVSKTQATWVITLFAVGNASFLPLTGFLTKRFGTIRVMCTSTALFTLMSWVCGISWSFNMLISARFFQGAVAGPLIPLSQSIMIMVYPSDKRNYAIAIWSMVALLGPILGPIVGGWLVVSYSWHWIFLINIPIGIVATAVIYLQLKERETPTEKRPIDYVGFFLLLLGAAALQVFLDKGQQYDWFEAKRIWALSILSCVAFVSFVIWERSQRDPIIDLTLFADRNFALGTFITGASYTLLFGAIVITPLWLQTQMGYDAFTSGLATSTMGIAPVCFARLVAKLLDITPARHVLALCFVLFAAVYMLFSHFTPQVSFAFVAFSRFLFGFPIALWLPALMALTFAHIPKKAMAMGSGIFHFVRILSGGIGTSLLVTMWERRGAFHQSRLVDNITEYNPTVAHALGKLSDMGMDGKQADATLYEMVLKQAFTLSTNDVFYFSCVLSLGFVILSFAFKARQRAAI